MLLITLDEERGIHFWLFAVGLVRRKMVKRQKQSESKSQAICTLLTQFFYEYSTFENAVSRIELVLSFHTVGPVKQKGVTGKYVFRNRSLTVTW